MKVVLKQDVPNLGKANEIHDVAPGYARNYLYPRGLAVPATEGVLRALEDLKEDQAAREVRLEHHAEQIAEKLEAQPLTFTVKAGETGRLYGSITAQDVAEALSELIGEPFDKRNVLLEEPLRKLGIHIVNLKLKGGLEAQARVIVEAEA
ncbi:MAG: 50S ribosomal protein L9 [Anaerolineae bacterium]